MTWRHLCCKGNIRTVLANFSPLGPKIGLTPTVLWHCISGKAHDSCSSKKVGFHFPATYLSCSICPALCVLQHVCAYPATCLSCCMCPAACLSCSIDLWACLSIMCMHSLEIRSQIWYALSVTVSSRTRKLPMSVQKVMCSESRSELGYHVI